MFNDIVITSYSEAHSPLAVAVVTGTNATTTITIAITTLSRSGI